MLDPKMEKAINDQIVAEFFSAYLYLSMSSYFESEGLRGLASWMRVQFQEEQFHAFRMFDYVVGRGGRAKLGAIEAPPTSWDSPLAVFEHTLKHEQKVTGLINKLVDLSHEISDHATDNFLRWFVTEQVEEESTADDICRKLRLIGTNGQGLLMLDKEMGVRVFTPPATTGEG
ncbi:MAG: ferritin [Candidatus Eisenbacteria bacterium]|nr:ferritin [Candidatus Eisenbacteria bacterium]